jgi:transposase
VNDEKYIGLDVHQATIVVAVMDSSGKLVMESILETKAATIVQFFAGLRGTLSVTFEEGTWSAWLYDRLHSRVDKLVVCNPRKNVLLKDGNKSDRIDARKLAELLRGNKLKPVYHGETGVRMLRELSRSYLTIVKDLSRVMNRLKAGYRSWAIPCAGRDVYYRRHRAQWLAKIRETGVRRAEATLRAAGHVATLAAASTPRTVSGKSQGCDHCEAATDSISRTDSSGAGGGTDPDSASFPQQATTLGL